MGEGGGTLGSTFDPFRLDYEPGRGLHVPDLELPEGVTPERHASRWALLSEAKGLEVPAMNRHYDLAHTL